MTNQQLYDAANQLESEGKISQTDAGQLSFIAQGVDYAPINGPAPSVSQVLSDPTQHNFIEELQNDAHGALSTGVGGAMYLSMLNDLETYQTASTPTNSSSLSITA